MSTEAAPAIVPAVVASESVVAPAAAVAAAASEPQPGDPKWIAARLEKERRAVLKAQGIKVPKGVQVADFLASEAANKAKTDSERAAEREGRKAKITDLEAKLASATEASAAVRVYAEMEVAKLDDKQRAALKSIAGDNPSDQLKTLSAWRLAGMMPAPAAVAAVAVPIAPPAHTAPTGTAPAPAAAANASPAANRYRDAKAMSEATPKDAARRAIALLQIVNENPSELLDGYTLR